MSNHDIVSVTFDRDDRIFVPLSGPSDRFCFTPQGVKKLYDYRAPRALLQEGDQAVVDSPYGTAVVTVRAVNSPSRYRGVLKYVVCKVDRAAAKRREQLTKDVAELTGSIERAVDSVIAVERLAFVAERCPDVAKALELLGELRTELAELGE